MIDMRIKYKGELVLIKKIASAVITNRNVEKFIR